MTSITLSRDQATRLLHSLQHLHTLHGPCDAPTCPHAAMLRELEGLIYLASAKEDMLNGAYIRFQQSLNEDPEFQAVAPFPCQDPHDLADALLQAITSPPASVTTMEGIRRDKFLREAAQDEKASAPKDYEHQPTSPYTPTPRLCAACRATLPSTTSEGTNLCARCSR